MAFFNGYSSYNYAPSAPPLPEPTVGHNPSSSGRPSPTGSGLPHQPPPYGSGYGYGYGYPAPPPLASTSAAFFPHGIDPEIVRSFQAVDRDRSGSIDEVELQAALSSGYQKFSLRTVRLLMFLFANPSNPSRIGPVEFATLWNCLRQWRAIFDRFDRDRSGEIDSAELRDALRSLGYAVPPSVIQVLISKYNDRRGGRGALNFDSFVECGTIVKGLTEKFKEKDPRYTGSATLTYDAFMSMIIPFIVPEI